MQVTSLTLQRMRIYDKSTFTFSPTTTLIIGPNGAGKTNILEGLFVLATGKSFRASSDKEMIQWEAELARVKCKVKSVKLKVEEQEDETILEVVVTHGVVAGANAPTKRYLVNGVVRRQIDLLGNLRVVLFWPEDLELVTHSPSHRRNYLDSVLIQVDREYWRNLNAYEKGIRHRNKLLEAIRDRGVPRSQLLFWDQLLIKTGNYITSARASYIEYINQQGGVGLTYQLEYDKSLISEARLEQYKEQEVAAKTTLVGPHRDDIFFKCQMPNAKFQIGNNEQLVDLAKFGSRGQQRLGVLWLKMAELDFIEVKTGERPVLLLDDIFSELDHEHQAIVLDLVGKQQTIITSADGSVTKLLGGKIGEVIELGTGDR